MQSETSTTRFETTNSQQLRVLMQRVTTWLGYSVDAIVVLGSAFIVAYCTATLTGASDVPVPMIALQGIAPVVVVWSIPFVGISVLRRSKAIWVIAMAGLVLGMVLVLPVAKGASAPAWASDAETITIATANLRHDARNKREIAKVISGFDTDILVLQEVTTDQLEFLDEYGVLDAYPYSQSSAPGATYSEMILTRLPDAELSLTTRGRFISPTIATTVGDTPLTIYGIHFASPIDNDGQTNWLNAFEEADALRDELDTEAVFAGDFNASPFHPTFRSFVNDELSDAHTDLGKGLSRSWGPMRFQYTPVLNRVMRLDHIVTTTNVVALDIRDQFLPSSDHFASIATLAVKQ